MTPLEDLIDFRRRVFDVHHTMALATWEYELRRRIAAQVESARRSIGQSVRQARARVERIQKGQP